MWPGLVRGHSRHTVEFPSRFWAPLGTPGAPPCARLASSHRFCPTVVAPRVPLGPIHRPRVCNLLYSTRFPAPTHAKRCRHPLLGGGRKPRPRLAPSPILRTTAGALLSLATQAVALLIVAHHEWVGSLASVHAQHTQPWWGSCVSQPASAARAISQPALCPLLVRPLPRLCGGFRLHTRRRHCTCLPRHARTGTTRVNRIQ